MPITYADKDKNAAAGQPERAWRDVDANEVKTVVNAVENDATQALSDASSAQADAVAAQGDIDTHEARTDNPHTVTKSQVGLGSVDNTADSGKPVSTLQQTALNLKADSTITTVSVTGAVTLDATAFGKLHVLSGTSADYTVVLPTAVGNTGLSISFKGSNTESFSKQATIDGNAAETIDGIITRLIAAGGAFTLISDGANWMVYDEISSWIKWSGHLAGMTSISNDSCYYSLLGKQLTINLLLVGTGNATTQTITMPPNLNSVNSIYFPHRSINNSGGVIGFIDVIANTSTVSCFVSATGGSWTASGVRILNFNVSLRIA